MRGEAGFLCACVIPFRYPCGSILTLTIERDFKCNGNEFVKIFKEGQSFLLMRNMKRRASCCEVTAQLTLTRQGRSELTWVSGSEASCAAALPSLSLSLSLSLAPEISPIFGPTRTPGEC